MERQEWKQKFEDTYTEMEELAEDHANLEKKYHKLEKKLAFRLKSQDEIYGLFEDLKKKYGILQEEHKENVENFTFEVECKDREYEKLFD
jgi:biotin-(acetyl-CoA carboxylase) ligase